MNDLIFYNALAFLAFLVLFFNWKDTIDEYRFYKGKGKEFIEEKGDNYRSIIIFVPGFFFIIFVFIIDIAQLLKFLF